MPDTRNLFEMWDPVSLLNSLIEAKCQDLTVSSWRIKQQDCEMTPTPKCVVKVKQRSQVFTKIMIVALGISASVFLNSWVPGNAFKMKVATPLSDPKCFSSAALSRSTLDYCSSLFASGCSPPPFSLCLVRAVMILSCLKPFCSSFLPINKIQTPFILVLYTKPFRSTSSLIL